MATLSYAARLYSFRQITKHMGVRDSECDSPHLIMFELVSGHHRLLIASTSKVCWSEDTSSKEKGILPPPTVLPSRHLPASLLSNHSTFGFLFLCPSSCLSGRFIGIPEEVCRLDPSCFPTHCLLGKFLLYYASSPTPLAPPTYSISYLPFFFILRKLRRNRSVKAQRIMQRSCHRLLFAPVGNDSELSAPSAPSESVVPLRRFNRQSVSTVWYGYYHLLFWLLFILFMSLLPISRQQNSHVGAKP